MNKAQPVSHVVAETSTIRAAAERMIGMAFSAIADVPARDEPLAIAAGFGRFAVRGRAPRQGRNPLSGELARGFTRLSRAATTSDLALPCDKLGTSAVQQSPVASFKEQVTLSTILPQPLPGYNTRSTLSARQFPATNHHAAWRREFWEKSRPVRNAQL